MQGEVDTRGSRIEQLESNVDELQQTLKSAQQQSATKQQELARCEEQRHEFQQHLARVELVNTQTTAGLSDKIQELGTKVSECAQCRQWEVAAQKLLRTPLVIVLQGLLPTVGELQTFSNALNETAAKWRAWLPQFYIEEKDAAGFGEEAPGTGRFSQTLLPDLLAETQTLVGRMEQAYKEKNTEITNQSTEIARLTEVMREQQRLLQNAEIGQQLERRRPKWRRTTNHPTLAEDRLAEFIRPQWDIFKFIDPDLSFHQFLLWRAGEDESIQRWLGVVWWNWCHWGTTKMIYAWLLHNETSRKSRYQDMWLESINGNRTRKGRHPWRPPNDFQELYLDPETQRGVLRSY
jgi:hypothetical protein